MLDMWQYYTDPELGYEIIPVSRITSIVDNLGRNTETAVSQDVGVIVTQDTGAILERVAESSYVSGSILVTSGPFQFRAAETGVDADTLIWHGKKYSVNAISDYNNHGVNWAVCNPDGLDNNA